MAYGRDPDQMTRGVGAIAARDGSRARLRQRVRQGVATRRRDQAMVMITKGALGRVALETTAVRQAERLSGGGSATQVVVSPPPIRVAPASGTAITPIGPLPLTSKPPASIIDIAPPVVRPPTTPGPVVVGGGGGRGVMPTGGPGTVTAIGPPVDITDIDIQPSAGTPWRNILLLGGAAVVAYLVLGRKTSP